MAEVIPPALEPSALMDSLIAANAPFPPFIASEARLAAAPRSLRCLTAAAVNCAVLNAANAPPMADMAVAMAPACCPHQLERSSSRSITGLTAVRMDSNAPPTVEPKLAASPADPARPVNLPMTWPSAFHRSRARSATEPSTSVNVPIAPVCAKLLTKSVTFLVAWPMNVRSCPILSMMSAATDATVHLRPSMSLPGRRFVQSTPWKTLTTSCHFSLRPLTASVWTILPHMSMNWFFTNVVADAAASPMPPNRLDMLLMAPAICSVPMASMTFCTAFATRFFTFSMAVPMPWVASLACCAKLAYWPKPSLLSFTTALLKSSKLTLPSFIASYRSLPFLSAPSSACASWLSWPGMAAWMDRHACMSTLPAESICVYWVSAFSCSMVEAPPASIALLNARLMFVASSRLLVSGASCWTMPVIADDVVGRPSRDLLIFLMLAAASSAE